MPEELSRQFDDVLLKLLPEKVCELAPGHSVVDLLLINKQSKIWRFTLYKYRFQHRLSAE